MTVTVLDEKKVEAFGCKLVGVLNGGALALMISIGHRTGLFDAMAGLDSSKSAESKSSTSAAGRAAP